MVRLEKREPKDAREIAQWLHDNVANGDHVKPTHVSAISRTLYWNSHDRFTWEVKHFGMSDTVTVIGVPEDMLVVFLLRFN